MANRTNLVTLNSQTYRLAQRDGVRQFSVTREPSEPDDLVPFVETVGFGYLGMGSSVLAARGQIDYALDVDLETWEQLGPGYDQNKLGLALDNPVTVLTTCRDNGTEGSAHTGTAANDASVGTVAWTNPTNAQGSTDNNVYATAVAGGVNTTQYLLCTNFGLAIPTTATILGIKIEAECKTSTSTATIFARPYKLGAFAGSTINGTSGAVTTTEAYIGAGGSTELWGTTWSPSDLNASNTGFGVYFTTGAAMTVSVDRVRITVYYTPSTRYLYIGAGNVSTKIRLDTLATVETKTFTHGDVTSTPAITDIVAVKDGPAPGADLGVRYGGASQPSDCMMLFAFGGQAQIQQIDTVNYNAADTYRTLNATKAYAGKFALALSATNTQSVVWKSTGVSGQNTGAFARLQSAAISSATLDLTNSANWSPSTPYQVGDFGSSIVALAEYQRGLVVGKPEGVYAFDQNYNAYIIYAMKAFRDDTNSRGLLAWGGSLMVPTLQDLMEIPARGDAAVGLSTLVSNLSPVKGYPTALASFGRFLFVAYSDGTDGYIVKMKRRAGEQVPTDYLHYPVTKVAQSGSAVAKINAMLVTDNGSGTVYLFYATLSATANKYDVGYCILAPETARRWESGGQWFSARVGSPDKRTVIEKLSFYGVSLDASNTWAISLAWDTAVESASFTSVGTLNATGRQVLTLTAGTNDTGYIYQLKGVCTVSANTNRPRLRAGSASANTGVGATGGVVVYGQRQPDQVDRFEFVVMAGDWVSDGYGGRVDSDAAETFNEIKALVNAGPINLLYEDYFGDTTVRKCLVQAVSYVEGEGDADQAADRFVRVRGRMLMSV